MIQQHKALNLKIFGFIPCIFNLVLRTPHLVPETLYLEPYSLCLINVTFAANFHDNNGVSDSC